MSKQELQIKFTGNSKDLSSNIDNINSKLSTLEDKSSKAAKGLLKIAAAAVSFSALKSGFEKSINSAVSFERIQRKLEVATGDSKKSFLEVSDIVRKYGLDLVSTADSFASFRAATRNTVIEGKAATKIFSDVSAAVASMGLNADNSNRVFKALEQMMSKGKVSAEELRGQLGDAGLAGAFGTAARAMGVTTGELDKMLSTGKLMSADFLPKFAAQLKNDLGSGALEAANGLQGSLNQITNSFFAVSASLGQELTPIVKSFASAVKSLEPDVVSAVKELKTFSHVVSALSDPLGGLTSTLVTAGSGLLVLKNSAALATIATTAFMEIATAPSLVALSVTVAAAAAPFLALSAAIAGTGFALKELYDVIKINEQADAALETVRKKGILSNKKATLQLEELRSKFEEVGISGSSLTEKLKELGIKQDAFSRTTFKNAVLVQKAIGTFTQSGLDDKLKSLKRFRKELYDVGISFDELAKNRNPSKINEAIKKAVLFERSSNASSKKFIDSMTKQSKTRLQKLTEKYKIEREKIVKINGSSSDQLTQLDNAYFKLKATLSNKELIMSKSRNDSLVRIEKARILDIQNFEIKSKETLLSEENKFAINKARIAFDKTKLNRPTLLKKGELFNISRQDKQNQNKPTFKSVDNRIAAFKTFQETKRAVEKDSFVKSQNLEKSNFESKLANLTIAENVRAEFIAARRLEFNDTQTARQEEFNVLQDESRTIELEKIAEFEQLKFDIIESYQQQTSDLKNEFSNVISNNENANFSNLISKAQTFWKSSKAMWKAGEEGKLAVTKNALGIASALINSENRKAFEIGKAAAIAQTVIKTYESAQLAFTSLAGIPIIGTALGAGAAAAAIAGGMARVSAISSTKFGTRSVSSSASNPSGSTSGSASSSAPLSPSVSSQVSQTQGANVTMIIQALDPSSIDETVMQKIGDKLAPILQNSFDSGQGLSVN